MKYPSLKAMVRHFGEDIYMACHLATGESYYRLASDRIVDGAGNGRGDMAWLFAPNCRIISMEEAMERMAS